MLDHSSNLQSRKGEVEAGELLPLQVYDFFVDLFQYQHSCYDSLTGAEVFEGRISDERLPLIDFGSVSFSAAVMPAVVSGMKSAVSVICAHNRGLDFSRVVDSVESGSVRAEDLIAPLLSGDMDALDSMAAGFKVGKEELVFLLINWLRPFFVAASEKLVERVDQEQWQENFCPVCGCFPDMSLFVGSLEGKRFLHCPLCEARWAYKRISCTVCGNEQMAELGFFEVEDTGFRVDYCDSCKGYIKSMRLGKFDEAEACDPIVENLLTAYIDSSVMEKGYLRP